MRNLKKNHKDGSAGQAATVFRCYKLHEIYCVNFSLIGKEKNCKNSQKDCLNCNNSTKTEQKIVPYETQHRIFLKHIAS